MRASWHRIARNDQALVTSARRHNVDEMILRACRTQERLLGGDPQEPIVRPFDAGLPHARQGWRARAPRWNVRM